MFHSVFMEFYSWEKYQINIMYTIMISFSFM